MGRNSKKIWNKNPKNKKINPAQFVRGVSYIRPTIKFNKNSTRCIANLSSVSIIINKNKFSEHYSAPSKNDTPTCHSVISSTAKENISKPNIL